MHFIAEIGNNHGGDIGRAREMLAEALNAGVDSVTFQVREPRFYESHETAHLRLPQEFFGEAAGIVHRAGRCGWELRSVTSSSSSLLTALA